MNSMKQIDMRSVINLKKNWHLLVLALIAILSFTLNFYAISQLGYGNAYYAAAIKSMTQSFKNFFYVSFDPAGMVSVDKPPLGLWVQAIFVLIFGYQGWVMLLPQALAGTCSSMMMYVLTAKHFGRPAGLVSSLIFTITPAVVVASRNNTMDMQLVFTLLAAVWFLFKAIEKTQWRYLFLCALFVGLGFNIKMLQAYMILPAIVVVYLIFAKEKFVKRIYAGLISLAILAAVSFAWVLAVDLTPAENRPYVDSSTNNTVAELIVGHNGIKRLYGQDMGGGRMNGGDGNRHDGAPGTSTVQGNDGQTMGAPPNGQGGKNNPPSMQNSGRPDGSTGATPGMDGNTGRFNQGGQSGNPGLGGGANVQDGGMQNDGGMAGNEIGSAGVLRLWNSGLYGQASWLIVLALFCLLIKIRRIDPKNLTVKQGVFVFWVVWLIVMYAFFSFAGFWHRYYLCMLAPAIAGIVGPGLTEMVQAFNDKHRWKQFLLPLSLLATLTVETIYVWSYTQLSAWLVPLMLATGAISLLLMALHYFKPNRLALIAATGCMLVSLLTAPFYWALTATIYVPQNITMPYAGPELASSQTVPGMTPNQETFTNADSGTLALEEYLVAHYKEGSYLVVSQRANDVAQFIVDTGLPAVAYGGFLGSDNSMTVERLQQLVSEGKVTYFMVSGQGGNANSELISYVKQNATLIDSSEYGVDNQDAAASPMQRTNESFGSSLYLFQ